MDTGSYNTITNPIPNYNRNPYLSKVVTRANLANNYSVDATRLQKDNNRYSSVLA